MNRDRITPGDFVAWKNDQVTKELMSSLEAIRDNLKAELINPNTILAQNVASKTAHILGQLQGIETILEIRCEDIIDEEAVDETE